MPGAAVAPGLFRPAGGCGSVFTPPALTHPHVIQRHQAADVAKADPVRHRIAPADKGHRDDIALIAQNFLHLSIAGRAFSLIGFGTGKRVQLVKTRIRPACIPGRITGIAGREQPVDGCPAKVINAAERLFAPDILPISIRCFLDDIDIDPGLGRVPLVKRRRLDRARKGISATERSTVTLSTPALARCSFAFSMLCSRGGMSW